VNTESVRDTVIWIGGPVPAALRTVAATLDLRAIAGDVETIVPASPDLLAVLVSADGTYRGKAQGRITQLLASHVLDYGVLLAIVSADRAFAVALQSQIIENIARAFDGSQSTTADIADISGLRGIMPDRIALLAPIPEQLAARLRSHDPGRPADPALYIDASGLKASTTSSSSLDNSARLHQGNGVNLHTLRTTDIILLRRAFNGFTKIVLEQQAGGRSEECSVWRVAAFKGDRSCEPFVAKAAKRSTLEVEYRTYQDFVRENVSFPFFAPFVESRRVKGATRTLLVSMFIARAHRLDEYLVSGNNAELVLSSVFSVALRGWRSKARLVHGASIPRIYVERQINAAKPTQSRYDEIPIPELLPDPASLHSAFMLARNSQARLPDPAALWNHLRSMEPFDYRECLAHGDMNVRNIFVRDNSVDTVLIDFSHSGQDHPMARDLAKLETSIAITVPDLRKKSLTQAHLTQLYRRPLLPPNDIDDADPRVCAVRQLRRHACGEGITSAEYEVLTACHLLRFASRPATEATAAPTKLASRRALCYQLACRLVFS